MKILLCSALVILFLYKNVECSILDNEVSTTSCFLEQEIKEEIASYQTVTNEIIKYFTEGPYKGKTWDSLAKFVDTFGSRISGSENLENSIDYMVELMNKNDLENVRTEKVQVPHWIRGKESAELLLPRRKKLSILGLGLSIGTPEDGIEADVVVVSSFKELRAMADDQVKGKIVVYAQPFVNYGETVEYRSKGASEAALKGAVAALVRSVTPFSLNTPHTGMQTYYQNVTQIPVASITVEDSLQFLRLCKRNIQIRIRLTMNGTRLETRTSRNTIGELMGKEHEEKVVVVSGHIDSWDVGEGAIDDGGGAFISWTAPVILKKLGLRPRRTIRAILWTAEEPGVIGSKAYAEAHIKEMNNFIFVMESDIGTFKPLGLSFTGSTQAECVLKEVGKLFSLINATVVEQGDPGPDMEYFLRQKVPAGGLKNENSKYFWYHHTDADRVSAISPDALDKCAAFWAAFSYVVADLSFDIPRSA